MSDKERLDNLEQVVRSLIVAMAPSLGMGYAGKLLEQLADKKTGTNDAP